MPEWNDRDEQPMRFTLPYIVREIDAGFCLLKRPINQESSFRFWSSVFLANGRF